MALLRGVCIMDSWYPARRTRARVKYYSDSSIETMSERTYPGIQNDPYHGMSEFGRMIRDAWVFGILPESETCAGWTRGQMDALGDKVHAAWEPYGHLASRLPTELRERHAHIHDRAVRAARSQGWNPELDDED
jgi:hypothetical protein